MTRISSVARVCQRQLGFLVMQKPPTNPTYVRNETLDETSCENDVIIPVHDLVAGRQSVDAVMKITS